MYYVYMAECRDGSIYTGWTTDVVKRISTHNSGQGAKYTRSRLPVVLRYSEDFSTKEEAMQREAFIKKLPREKKLQIINNSNDSLSNV